MQTEYSPPRAIAERLVGSSELDRVVVTKRKTESPPSYLGRATSRFLPPSLKKQTPTIRLEQQRHSPYPVESQQPAENMAVKQEPREDGSGGDAEQQQPQQQQLQQLQQPPVFETTPNEIKVELEPQRPETTTRVKNEIDSSSSGNQPHEELTTTTTSNSSDLSDNRPQAHVSEQHNESRRPAASRGRRKSRFVLKFHHQALPQEYLDHYEATQAAQEAAALLAASSSPSTPSSSATSPTNMANFPFAAGLGRPRIDEHLALKQFAAMQEAYSSINSNQVPSPTTIVGQQQQRVSPPRRSVISSVTTVHRPATPRYSTSQQRQPQQHPQPRPPMRYADLPYMGEITLENSKPRRGRKPKKADICHLIYKNYGQIVPGTPGLVGGQQQQQQQQQQLEPKLQDPVYQRTDVQNRISSLLEKRLTQEQRQAAAQKLRQQQLQLQLLLQQSEPLNLCLRDVEDASVEVPSDEEEDEPSTPGIVVGESSSSSAGGDEPTIQLPWATRNNHHNNNNSVNNNNDGQFVHPETVAALQSFYQHQQQQQQQRLLLEQRMKLKRAAAPTILQPQAQSTPAAVAAVAAMQMHVQPPPAKRKRSAIFIPPVPPENNNNPATEVSICKFKFTGGDKPSLQEKKSLSVDSGGNFRYYSGTGDKSMRGYEFFPRESLQQVPGGPTPALLKGTNTSPIGTGGITERRIVSAPSSPQDEVAAHRNKRKTRKSLQREKLEQTFKEKGFLIQTQQRDAAEGSTFCKFRRLRKFTRYLYRSWKDHLPDDVRELSAEQARVAAAAAAAAAAAMASNDNINDQMVVDRMPRQVEQPSAAM
ncbi:transcription factor SPT20 homolog isoform X2 [Trichogramma pretiosum]|nr:transcription factor SPT20 homolog isoform X2 [Trichogramma pretiosum]